MEFIVTMLLECILLSHTIRVYSALGIGNRIDIGLGHNKWLIERERRERQSMIFQRSRRNAEGNNCGSPENVIRHQVRIVLLSMYNSATIRTPTNPVNVAL